MKRPDFPFDAVLFDLDGTLLATDRFWIPAARVGARRAFAELQLERELPSAEEWMGLVGLPLAEGFEMLFSDLSSDARGLVMRRCVEEEHFALESGSAALLPGVVDTLSELSRRGVSMGIASNCSQAYLDSAMEQLDLGRFIPQARCLESSGIRNKAEMIEDLLLAFGTRSAVMVGDRAGDRDAAHANGLPHVHLENGFAPRAEQVQCEACIADFLELIPRLEGRTRWLQALLGDLGLASPRGGPRTLGITGHSGAGKSIFAEDLARCLREGGREAVVLSLATFQRPAGSVPPADLPFSALELPGHLLRIEALMGQVLEPHLAGEALDLDLELEGGARSRLTLAPEALLVLEGPYLLHPRLRAALDRVVFLELPVELSLRRVAARELPLGRLSEYERVREQGLPAQTKFDEVCPPHSRADRVLCAANPLGPGGP